MRILSTILLICLFSLFFRGTTHAQWVQTDLDSVTVGSLTFSGSRLYATTSNGLYVSTSNGVTWTGCGFTGGYAGPLAHLGTNIFVHAGGGGTVVRSTDNGITWTEADSGIVSYEVIRSLCAMGTTLFVGADYNTIYRSVDSGASWTISNAGLPNTRWVRHNDWFQVNLQEQKYSENNGPI